MAITSAAEFRTHFPIFQDRVHLCSCSEGAASFEAMEAVTRFVESWRSWGAPWDAWMAEVEQARGRFARLIGARPGDVAVVPNASIGAYAVASALSFDGQRNGIVTSDLEFPSISHVWLGQRRRGAQVSHVRQRGGVIELADWEAAISPRAHLVSAFHVSYANGARNDLKALARVAHDRGALLFVDAYQSAGVVPFDVADLEVDFLVAGTLKYLCGSPGLAFLYVRPDLARALEPTLTGWLARVSPFSFDPLTLDFAEDARRFQTGTPAVVAAYTANAAMELLARIDAEQAWRHVQTLVDALSRRLLEAGLALFSPADPAQRGPLVAVYAQDASRVGRALAERGFLVSPRGSAVRVSFHYYNDQSDVERVGDELVRLLQPVRATAPPSAPCAPVQPA